MKTPAAFFLMLGLAALTAFGLWRLAPAGAGVRSTPARELVLAGHAATWGLGHALAEGTGFTVAPAWPAGLPWAEQAEFARGDAAGLGVAARAATAVLTLRTAARDDALASAARAANPRILELDASGAADGRSPVVRLPPGAPPAGAAFALSPAEAARLAERIAAQFGALRPADAPRVAENLRRLQERLFRLRAQAAAIVVAAAVPEVAAFSAGFDSWLDDLGVPVVVRGDPDEAVWPEGRDAALVAELRGAGVRASVHAWAPGPRMLKVLAEAGVRPVVLEPLTTMPSHAPDYFTALETNLARLANALVP